MRLFSLLWISLSCFSGASLQASALSPEQIQLKLKKYDSLQQFTALFKEKKILKDLGVTLASRGRLEVNRAEAVVLWQVNEPSPLTLRLTRDTVEITEGAGASQTTQRWDLKKGAGSAHRGLQDLLAWLQLDAAAISKNYLIEEGKGRELLCTPKKDDSSPFQSLTLTLSSQGFLQKLLLLEKSGDRIEIEFQRPN